MGLAAILRIADALDRGHAQRVRDVSSVIKDGNLHLVVEADSDADLEIWAAEEASAAFRESYDREIQIVRAKAVRTA